MYWVHDDTSYIHTVYYIHYRKDFYPPPLSSPSPLFFLSPLSLYTNVANFFSCTNLYSEVDENDSDVDEDDLLADGGVPEDDIEVESQE